MLILFFLGFPAIKTNFRPFAKRDLAGFRPLIFLPLGRPKKIHPAAAIVKNY